MEITVEVGGSRNQGLTLHQIQTVICSKHEDTETPLLK
jgi:hypothetical protein